MLMHIGVCGPRARVDCTCGVCGPRARLQGRETINFLCRQTYTLVEESTLCTNVNQVFIPAPRC